MPRSPSRDLSDRFAGNRGYFRHGDAIRRGKYVVALVALMLAVAWVVADVALPARAITAHTHGPLANPHAHWENDCAVCHRPYTASGSTSSSVFHARDRWHDLTCEKCHAGGARRDRSGRGQGVPRALLELPPRPRRAAELARAHR